MWLCAFKKWPNKFRLRSRVTNMYAYEYINRPFPNLLRNQWLNISFDFYKKRISVSNSYAYAENFNPIQLDNFL